MSLVFAGVCSHAPGITSRAAMAEPKLRDSFYAAFEDMRVSLEAACPDALIVMAAEHFANFFMNNMPAYAMGMGDFYEGPIEDENWLAIKRRRIPGNAGLSQRLISSVLNDIDVAFAEEWKFDHGIMVPLHFLTPRYDLAIIPANINCQGPPLTPLHRAWAFGEALRKACDAVPERIALVGTGGISHWPATPDSGKINEAWDREFLDRWSRNDREALLSYSNADTYRDAGQGGFEIRTFHQRRCGGKRWAWDRAVLCPHSDLRGRLHHRYDGIGVRRFMAHAIVEYTDNLGSEADIPGLLAKIAAKMRDSGGVFPIGGIRIRANPPQRIRHRRRRGRLRLRQHHGEDGTGPLRGIPQALLRGTVRDYHDALCRALCRALSGAFALCQRSR